MDIKIQNNEVCENFTAAYDYVCKIEVMSSIMNVCIATGTAHLILI